MIRPTMHPPALFVAMERWVQRQTESDAPYEDFMFAMRAFASHWSLAYESWIREEARRKP